MRKIQLSSFIIVTLLVILLPLVALAETAGSVRYEARDFFEGQVGPVQHGEDLLTVSINGKYNLFENARVLIGPELQLSSAPHLVEGALPMSAVGQLRDTLLEFREDSVHFQVGSMIKAWEGPDGYNPMDIATVKNFRDPFSPENMGSFGLALSGGDGEFTWDALYIPYQTEVVFPGERSRWLPRHVNLAFASQDARLLLPAQPQYSEGNHRELNSALRDNYGGRVQLHMSEWDFSAAYFEGAAQVPGIAPTINGEAVSVGPPIIVQATNPLMLQAVEYRRRTVAAGLVASGVEGWIFRLAGRYDMPFGFNAAVPQQTTQFVGAAEKTITVFGRTVISSLGYAFGQKFQTQSGDFTILDPFASAWMFGLRWPLTETLTFLAYGLWSPATRSEYGNLHLEKKLGDHWSVNGGVQWMNGLSNSPMGIWADQNRVSAAATYLF